MIDISKFVETYERYFFSDGPNTNSISNELLGIKSLHTISKSDEEEIVNKLINGIYDVQTIAWKLGNDIHKTNQIKTRYYKYNSSELKSFCNRISAYYNTNTYISEYDLYTYILSQCPKGIGSVQIINAMFFLTRGRVPIYDYYANVAVKALLENVNPQEVYVSEAPSRSLLSKGYQNKKYMAMNLMEEYKRLLIQLKYLSEANSHFDSDSMFISRGLDRALWVYGHATEKWKGN